MDANTLWIALISSTGGVIVGVMTWLGARSAAASKRDEAEITSRGDEWQKILTASQNYADRRIADQGAEIGKQGEKIKCLEGKVGHLEQENERTKTKYWKAIFYGRSWRLLHPESIPLIEVPPEILDDL